MHQSLHTSDSESRPQSKSELLFTLQTFYSIPIPLILVLVHSSLYNHTVNQYSASLQL